MQKKIVGYEAEKREMAKLNNMIVNAAKFREIGIRLPKGVLLWGEPGVGKTVLAQSIASDGVKLFEVKAANCCRDDAASELKSVFARAKSNTPCVILLDELDKIAGMSNTFYAHVNEAVNKVLLQELDDIPDNLDLLVVATCNEKDSLGPALTRSGRFDRIINVRKPDKATRKAILEMYFSVIKIKNDLDFEHLAKITLDFSCAALECIANESAIRAYENGHEEITFSDVREVIDKMSFGTEAQATARNEENLRKTAIHEAGHCLAALMLYPDAVEGITIMRRGDTEGHVRFTLFENEASSLEDCENLVTIALAGHVAEKEIFGTYFLGSSTDLMKAAATVKKMIVADGMYGYKYIAANEMISRSSPERTSYELAEFQQEILERLDKKAAKLIAENRKLFDLIVDTVMERQTLTRDEILELKKKSEAEAAA